MLVPFDMDGNQTHKTYSGGKQIQYIEYKAPFEAVMKFHSVDKYSSNTVTLTDTFGKCFFMSLAEFVKCIPSMDRGVIRGMFEFKKNGRYFTIAYVDAYA